jgi:hypothetical protein
VVATEKFRSASSRMTLPFLGIENLLQRHRRVTRKQCKKCNSMPRLWPCVPHTRVALNGLQFIHPNLKDILFGGMEKPLERC